MPETYDLAVIGAGVFGSWIAYHARNSGRSVALLDAYGAANGRASSAGESRVLRMGYGASEIYTVWAARSRVLWLDLFERAGQPELFVPSGVLWTAPPSDAAAAATRKAFEKHGIPLETISPGEFPKRFPQFRFDSEQIAAFEPLGGALLARRSVRLVVEEAVRNGVDYFREAAVAPDGADLRTQSGRRIAAGEFVYACGPWLPKIFPELLQERFRITRQELFFFGCPPGDHSFTPPGMPVWIDFSDPRGPYSIPDLENRGFKIGFDRHGAAIDPDTIDRVAAWTAEIRAFLAERFPAMAGAPLIDSRVCQYSNTSTGDFLIDQHPEWKNVWLAGGGSGHGFKHGPMIGEYLAALLDGKVTPDPRFALSAKGLEPQRAVY